MKKNFQLILSMFLAVVLSTNVAYAQLPNGSTVPDFTLTDLDGVEHNLYSYLDSGKYVIIDVSATWCPPCWSFHEQHILKGVHDTYGPDGTDEMVVLFIEGDAETGLADLQGSTSSTQGNWLDGTPYPILDGAEAADVAINDLEISGFPTVYMVCPTKKIYDVGRTPDGVYYYTPEGYYNETTNLLGCALPSDVAAVSIEGNTGFEGEYCGEQNIAPSVTIGNRGGETITSATLDFAVNGELVQSYEYTGEVVYGDNFSVSFDAHTVEGLSGEATVTVSSINGEAQEEPTIYSFTINSPDNGEVIYVELRTDDYPCEMFWTLTNSENNALVFARGNSTVTPGAQVQGSSCPDSDYPDVNTVYYDTVYLPADACYNFYLMDDWGDGFGSDGYLKIKDVDGNEVLNIGSGAFQAEFNYGFKGTEATTTSNNEIQGASIAVQPNPTNGLVNVSVQGQSIKNVDVSVFNMAGKLMQTEYFDNISNNIQLDLSKYTDGVYLIQLTSNKESSTNRIILNK